MILLKLDLTLTVVSDYLHISRGNAIPLCKIELEKMPYYGAFIGYAGEPVIPGSSLKGAIRSRCELLIDELPLSVAGDKRCKEICFKFLQLRRPKQHALCCWKGKPSVVQASWRHIKIYKAITMRCKGNRNFVTPFGNGGENAKASIIEVGNFHVEKGTLKLLTLEVFAKEKRSKFLVEAMPKGSVFGGSIMIHRFDKQEGRDALALTLFGLGMFKRNNRGVILIGKFKYAPKTVIQERDCNGVQQKRVGKRATFGQVKVEINKASLIDLVRGKVKEVDVEEVLSDAESTLHRRFSPFDGFTFDFDEIDELKRLRR